MADPDASGRGRRGAAARLGRRRRGARRRWGWWPAACGRRQVADAVRRTGARVVHAHNTAPTFGWRALAAAREAGARVVLHLHNYRLVCAVGTCFTRGEDCTRCHGRNTLPGVRLNCRGGSRAESAAYAAGLALWQRRLGGRGGRDRGAERVRARPPARARRAARRQGARARLGPARRSPSARARRAASSCSPRAASRPRRDSRTSSTRARGPGCRSWSPGTARERAALERARRGAAGHGALRRPGLPRRTRGASRAGRPWRSCPRGTPRSCRWRRWRRWRPAFPRSRRAPAA